MYQAKILYRQGMKIARIAQILEADRRSVYNWLHDKVFQPDCARRGRPRGSGKLGAFHCFIEEELRRDLDISGQVLFDKLVGMGYGGKTTILNDYLRKRREELAARAVRRFETVAGLQAQVDWADAGRVWKDGRLVKRYCFVMKLGFSRRSYMEFTTSMKQPVLFACMKRGFSYFGGIPGEVLFDNMKTAFLYSAEEARWAAHPKMAAFAAHYGFVPRRCRVRRPQTKGKVEREIRYLRSSFFPGLRIEGIDISVTETAELNDYLLSWLKRVDAKKLREFNCSRLERFETERPTLQALPVAAFDHREPERLKVLPTGKVHFQSNRYSVDASFPGKTLEGRYDPDAETLSLYYDGVEVKHIGLLPKGRGGELIDARDRASLLQAWYKDRERHERKVRRIADRKKRRAQREVRTTDPCVFDHVFGVVTSKEMEVPA